MISQLVRIPFNRIIQVVQREQSSRSTWHISYGRRCGCRELSERCAVTCGASLLILSIASQIVIRHAACTRSIHQRSIRLCSISKTLPQLVGLSLATEALGLACGLQLAIGH